jgi:hypothetical protein
MAAAGANVEGLVPRLRFIVSKEELFSFVRPDTAMCKVCQLMSNARKCVLVLDDKKRSAAGWHCGGSRAGEGLVPDVGVAVKRNFDTDLMLIDELPTTRVRDENGTVLA